MPPSAIAPTTFTLDNGLRLIVQPETISDTVQVYGRIKSNEDLQAPKGEKGVADVLDGLYRFGTEHLNRLQYQQALDAIAAKAQAGSDFSLQVPAGHFRKGIKLLADNELHPALPPQAFRIVQHQVASATAGEVQSPDFLADLGLSKLLYPKNDPALRHATAKSVMGLTLDKVKAYRDKVFRPDMATLVVVGKVDPEEARKVIAASFGDWHAKGDRPQTDYGPVPANKPGELHVPDSSASQDQVQLAQTLDVSYNDPVHYALQLGNQVLGGGFYASRFYHDLRDENGLVYNVDSRFDFDLKRSTYTVTYGCDPDKVSAARNIVVRDLQQMQHEPVSGDALHRAKGIILRQIPLGESSFDAIGNQLLQLSVEGRPLDAVHQAGEHYLALSAQAVQEAYRKHIRPKDLVTTVKGPAPQ